MRTYILGLLHPSGARVTAALQAEDFGDIAKDYAAARQIGQPCIKMSISGSANLGELIDLAAFDAIDVMENRPSAPVE